MVVQNNMCFLLCKALLPHTTTQHAIATYCNTLKHTETSCLTLQNCKTTYTATHCPTLQHTAYVYTYVGIPGIVGAPLQHTAFCVLCTLCDAHNTKGPQHDARAVLRRCSVWQCTTHCVTVYCSVLRCIAVHCSVL